MGTRPNKSAGTVPKEPPKPLLSYSQLNTLNGAKKYFRIKAVGDNSQVVWNFALLPAVEAALQYGPNASTKGSITVPEVKAGMMHSTAIKYKNFIVPGGSPVVQGIGIQATTRQFVGLFIGTEGTTSFPSLNPIYRTDNKKGDYTETNTGYSDNNNAVTAAEKFDKEIVQAMKPVIIEIKSDTSISYECVIVNFKYYIRSANRVYYVIDTLSTKYK